MENKYKIGDVIQFGRYPYGPNGEIQPLEWIVIGNNDSDLFLISKNAIDTQFYKKRNFFWENPQTFDCAWNSSDIRRWLNSDFMAQAFSSNEISQILTSRTEPDCFDNVFLLSREEFEEYMPEKYFYTQATPYATKQGYAKIRFGKNPMSDRSRFHDTNYDATKTAKGICHEWWLRSYGEDRASIQTVASTNQFFDIWAEKYGYEHLKSSLVYLSSRDGNSPIYSRGQYGADNINIEVAIRPAIRLRIM